MSQPAFNFTPPRDPIFDGDTFDVALDQARLGAQYQRVWAVIRDGAWRTLQELAQASGDPEASVSARLRDMRKPKFGAHDIQRRRRGTPERGCWEYRLVVAD